MITSLVGSVESITAVLAGAVAATEPTYTVAWKGPGGPKGDVGLLTGTTAKVLVVGVDGQAAKEVESIQLYNADSAAVTVTINKKVDSTSYPLAKVTVPSLATLSLTAAGLRVVDSSGQLLQSINTATDAAGVAAAEAAAVESGTIVRKTVLTLTDLPVTVGNTTGISFGGTKIYDFPAGRILILGVTVANISFDLTDAGNATPIAAADGGDIAIGTTAPDDGTLTDTDVDLLPSTSIDPISDGVDGAALAASAQFDGTTEAVDAYFNILIDDADVEDEAEDVLLVSGTVTIHWVNLGDY